MALFCAQNSPFSKNILVLLPCSGDPKCPAPPWHLVIIFFFGWHNLMRKLRIAEWEASSNPSFYSKKCSELFMWSLRAVPFKKLWVGMSYINFFDHPLWNSNFLQGTPLQNRKCLRTTHPQNFFHIFCRFSITKSRKIPPTHRIANLSRLPPYRIAKKFRPPPCGIFKGVRHPTHNKWNSP